MPALNTVIPVLRLKDIEASRSFYETVLEFKVDWLWHPPEGGPGFAQISRDGLRIYLSERDEGAADALIYLYVENVDAWHKQLLIHAVPVDSFPEDKFWGNREMQFCDPEGNCLRICTPLKIR